MALVRQLDRVGAQTAELPLSENFGLFANVSTA